MLLGSGLGETPGRARKLACFAERLAAYESSASNRLIAHLKADPSLTLLVYRRKKAAGDGGRS